jgi:iron complex outermembrane receptor protein
MDQDFQARIPALRLKYGKPRGSGDRRFVHPSIPLKALPRRSAPFAIRRLAGTPAGNRESSMLQYPKLTALALAVTSLSQPAFAADTETPEVIVTATRFAAPGNFLPVGARVITAQQIADSAASSLPEVLSRLGGIALRNNSGDASPQLDLRGFGMTGDQNTLILLDGQRISENEQTPARLSAIPLDAVERIEILPGSGAVLYGSGATEGTLNIITREPRYGRREGDVGAGIGSFNSKKFWAGLSVGGENLALALQGANENSDNYRKNNAIANSSASGDLRYKLSDGEIYAKFGGARERLGMPGSLTTSQAGADPTAASTPQDNSSVDSRRFALGGTFERGGSQFAAELSHRSKDSFANYVVFGSTTEINSDQWSFTPRYRQNWNGAGMTGTLVAGVDVNRWEYRRQIPVFGSDIHASQNDRAFYVEGNADLDAATHASAGIRWQQSSIRSVDVISAPTPKTRDDAVKAFELGLRHQLGGGYSAYGRWGSSFRLANVDDDGWVAPGLGLLNPQTSRDLELGVEYRSGSRQLRAALFQSRVANEIHLLAYPVTAWWGSSFGGYNVNLPPTQHQGLELDGRWPLGDLAALGAHYRYTQASFLEGLAGSQSIAGNQIPLVPRHRLTLAADIRPAANYLLAASVRYVGSQRYDNDQVNAYATMPAYTVVDMKLTRKLEQWKLSLSVDNLFNRNYFSYGIIPDPSVASYNVYPEAGRRVSVSAELKI